MKHGVLVVCVCVLVYGRCTKVMKPASCGTCGAVEE